MKLEFSLQTVLDARHDRVEALEIGLARLIGLQIECQTLLNDLTSKRSVLIGKLLEAQIGHLDLFEVSNLRANLITMDANLDKVSAELAHLTEAVALKRKELVIAKQDEETLVILRRKRQDAFQKEMDRVDSKNQDDLYIARAFRQMRSEE